MEVFILTDDLINKGEVDLSAIPHGGYDALSAFLLGDGTPVDGMP